MKSENIDDIIGVITTLNNSLYSENVYAVCGITSVY